MLLSCSLTDSVTYQVSLSYNLSEVKSFNKIYNFTGRIIGLFRLSYLTPGLMAAGVTEVIVEKEQEQTKKEKIKKKDDKKELEGKKDRHSSKDK